jgi:ABC-2 type transport system permease protein
MLKTWLILKNELVGVVTRRSFLITLVLLPLTGMIILFVISIIQKSTGADPTNMMEELFLPETSISMEGFVDASGLVTTIPSGYETQLTAFSDEASARSALAEGAITAYYLIDKDFLETGKVIYVRPDFNPLGASSNSSPVEALLAYTLTEGDLDLAYRVQNPMNVTEVTLAKTPTRDADNPLTFFLPYIVTFLFYGVILGSSTLMLNSISSEKQNRTMEILVTSVSPQQMLTGKIFALGLAGLLQTVVWSGSGYLMLMFSGERFALGDAFKLPVSVLAWGVLFFLLGYAVYASLMAAVGALVPNLREASQTTTLVIIPLIIPLFFISVLIQTPDSPLSIALSLIPLTSPVSMMTRLAATTVPLWQIGLSVLLLAGTAVIFVRAGARLFRAQNLLSGQSVNAMAFLKALVSK